MRGDLRREILNILESRDPSNKGLRWTEVASALDEQSSIVSRHPSEEPSEASSTDESCPPAQPVEASELSEVIKALETDGTLRVSGDRDRRTLRRAGGGGA